MVDEKDLEIARLQGELNATNRRGGLNPVHILAWLILAALAIAVAMTIFGASLPKGWEFEDACKSVTNDRASVRRCMRNLDRIYIGPDRESNRRNAAAQWAADEREFGLQY